MSRYSRLLTLLLLAACSSRPEPVRLPQVIPDPVATESLELDVPVPRDSVGSELIEARVDSLGESERDTAVALLHEAVERDSLNISAAMKLARALGEAEDWAGAVAVLERALAIDSGYGSIERDLHLYRMRRDRGALVGTLLGDIIEVQPRAGPRVSIAAVGDIHLGTAWPAERAALPPDHARPVFEHVSPILDRADIAFGNLETVLADTGNSRKCRPGSTACYAFRVPRSFAATLREAGFQLMSTNNNHATDFGEWGQVETATALNATGIVTAGPASGVARWEHDGVRFAMVAYSTGGGQFRIQEVDRAAELVRSLDRTADIVIVSFHGGAEGEGAQNVPRAVETAWGEDRGDVYAFAHAVIDAGADLVLGHGPHVLRGVELYRGRLIAYSLGNFSTWEIFGLRGARGLSGILRVTLAPNGVATAAEWTSLVIQPPGIPTPDPLGRSLDKVRQLSRQDFGNEFFDENGRWQLKR